MKHLFIINPKAGKGKSLNYINEIKEIFRDRPNDYIIEITKYIGHATEIAKRYTSKNTYRVYSIGGDGTLNEVLNGMARSTSSIGVIPSGTGNDFIKTLINDKNHKDILNRTIFGKEILIDLAKANERYFINISSLGFDAEVAYNAKKFKKYKLLSGLSSYLLSIFYTLSSFKGQLMNITIDGVKYSDRNILLAIGNGKSYGGGILITPEADIMDGYLDICMVKEVGILKLLRFLPKALKGKHGTAKEVTFLKGKKISVEGDSTFTINFDGEVEKCEKAEFQIIENEIKFIIPK